MFSYDILYNKCVYMSTIVLYFVRFELLCTVIQKKNTETHLCLRIFCSDSFIIKKGKLGFHRAGSSVYSVSVGLFRMPKRFS